MGVRHFPPDHSPADAEVWQEMWKDFIGLAVRGDRSAAGKWTVHRQAQYLLDTHFPELTLSTADQNRALTVLLNLPEDTSSWPPEVTYNRIRQLLYKRAQFARVHCWTVEEVDRVDAYAAEGLSEVGQAVALWLDRKGGLTPEDLKTRYGWSNDQLAGLMARIAVAHGVTRPTVRVNAAG